MVSSSIAMWPTTLTLQGNSEATKSAKQYKHPVLARIFAMRPDSQENIGRQKQPAPESPESPIVREDSAEAAKDSSSDIIDAGDVTTPSQPLRRLTRAGQRSKVYAGAPSCLQSTQKSPSRLS